MAIYALIPGGDFGIAVIIFTIIIRMLLWPLVKKQLHQVKAMRKLQPELVRLKKKAKGNKQLEGMMMLELYKKHNVNPFRTIGILLVQLPIFIGLYHVIQIFTAHRNELAKFTYSFLEQWQPVAHLIKYPDSFNQNLFGIVDLTQHAISNNGVSIFLIFLAIASGVLQYISSKQTMPQQEGNKKGLRQLMAEASEGKQADQSEINAVVMQKMTKFLPVFMVVIMLSLPGAIALYYAVSTAVAVLQQHILLQRDEEELEDIADIADTATQAAEKKAKSREAKARKAEVVHHAPTVKTTHLKPKSKKKRSNQKATVRVVAKTSSKGGTS